MSTGTPSLVGLTATIKAKGKNAKINGEKIILRESIHKVLMETNTREESLYQQHKEASDLYQRQRLAINPDDVVKLYRSNPSMSKM